VEALDESLIALHPGLWEIVCSGLQPPEDPKSLTNDELAVVHLNGQATRILLSALDGNEYNQVMNVDVEKQICDTLHLAHEGVDKVRRAKIDLLMVKLNRFVIIDELIHNDLQPVKHLRHTFIFLHLET